MDTAGKKKLTNTAHFEKGLFENRLIQATVKSKDWKARGHHRCHQSHQSSEGRAATGGSCRLGFIDGSGQKTSEHDSFCFCSKSCQFQCISCRSLDLQNRWLDDRSSIASHCSRTGVSILSISWMISWCWL